MAALPIALGLLTGAVFLASLLYIPFTLILALFNSAKAGRHLREAGIALLVAAGSGLVYFGLIAGGRSLRARPQGMLTACKSNLKNLGTALEMYSTDNYGRYPKSLASLTPNYLKVIPNCPSARKDTYSDSFQSFWDGKKLDSYTINCQGNNHGSASVAPNYPVYSSYTGLILPGEGN